MFYSVALGLTVQQAIIGETFEVCNQVTRIYALSCSKPDEHDHVRTVDAWLSGIHHSIRYFSITAALVISGYGGGQWNVPFVSDALLFLISS